MSDMASNFLVQFVRAEQQAQCGFVILFSFPPLTAVIFVLPPEFLFLGSCFLLAACEFSRGYALLRLDLMTRPSLSGIAAAQLTFS